MSEREAVPADIFGEEAVPVSVFGFKPARNVFADGGPTLHGKTGGEMSRIVNPEHPEKWRDDDVSRHIDLNGPNGSLSGYVADRGVFEAICKALGVKS